MAPAHTLGGRPSIGTQTMQPLLCVVVRSPSYQLCQRTSLCRSAHLAGLHSGHRILLSWALVCVGGTSDGCLGRCNGAMGTRRGSGSGGSSGRWHLHVRWGDRPQVLRLGYRIVCVQGRPIRIHGSDTCLWFAPWLLRRCALRFTLPFGLQTHPFHLRTVSESQRDPFVVWLVRLGSRPTKERVFSHSCKQRCIL